jgi:CDP-diacylglycerol--glycerol-3-phosphate 3-phosphatidyltransferase
VPPAMDRSSDRAAGTPSGPDRAGGEAKGEDRSLSRVITVPNLLSAIRIVLIPVFVLLILHHGTEEAGLLLLGGVVATDWIDGYIARHTGQVSNLGKVLDPVADRLAIAAGLIALMVRGAFPLWAGLLVLVRDGLVILAGAALLFRLKVRMDVRWIGKFATFALMVGIPLVAWGRFGLWLHGLALPVGWVIFTVGIVTYYLAAVIYTFDVAAAVKAARGAHLPETGSGPHVPG